MTVIQTWVPPNPPIRFDVTPADIEAGATSLCDKTTSLIDQLAHREDGGYTFTNTILPFIEAENARLRTTRWLQFFSSTNPDPSLRDASTKASKLLADAELDIFMRADFYKAVSSVREQGEKLDHEYEIYLKRLGEEFEQKGLSISENVEALGRFTAIQKRLNSLTIEAFKKLNGDSTGLWFSINELEGLPPSFFENRITREREQDPATSGTVSEVWVSIKESDSLPIMKLAIKAESRKKMFLTREHRCEKNIPLYREIFILRDEAARLLGFEHHAAFRIHYKMAGTSDSVLKFLDNVEARLKDHRDDEIKTMLELKRKDVQSTNEKTDRLFLWDKTFYDRIYKEKECSFDQKLVTEYFSLEHSLEVMLQTFEHLFGIRIQVYQSNPGEVWHEDVQIYTIWDAEDQDAFLGWFYFDPYPRNGKYTHFGHYNLQPGYTTPTGSRFHPTAVLVTNFPRPTPSIPSLLMHDQLRRLFHELGHAMHNILSKTKCARLHGLGGNRDFAEAVGIMFENFLWTPRHMKEISLHYSYLSDEYFKAWKKDNPEIEQPGKKIGDELIKRLVRLRGVGAAGKEIEKVWMARFDMTIYSPQTHEDIVNMDFQILYNKMRTKATGFAGPEVLTNSTDVEESWRWGHGYSGFRAIAGGYDAGYYTYLLSQVYSFDLFRKGFLGDTMNKENGRRFRKMVLEPGGSVDAMTIMKEFLGREVDEGAFWQGIGL